MSSLALLLIMCTLMLVGLPSSSADVVRHTFHVGNYTIQPLCQKQVVVAVNKQLPGPSIKVREGDTLEVNVINESPYNITIHWHGIFQLRSGWADGPGYVTQCPIQPGNKYKYKFNVTGQEGTLWWHAHVSFLRATVYGALIIRPKTGYTLPYKQPHREVPILLGEWWDANVMDVENEALASGGAPNISNAYTINGKPGDLYPCSRNDTFQLTVVKGRKYLLRIVNAALNNQLFFKIAGHNLTVIAADAAYTMHYVTDVVAIAPGQTIDALLIADQSPGAYYMAARPYFTLNASFDNTTTTGILRYKHAPSSQPVMPVLPAFNDTPTAHKFYSDLKGMTGTRGYKVIPHTIDEHMFVTIGLGLEPCPSNTTCAGPNNSRLRASMNNVSFQLPSTLSILEAHYRGVRGIFTNDFPDNPPTFFDFTNATAAAAFQTPVNGTRVKRLAYNTSVEIVFQNTAIVSVENHPIHLHGFNFFVVAQGFGNFNRTREEKNYNLVNPQERNTIAVPVGGWAVIRWRANNPGVWLMHCHLDVHLPWGLAAAFVVDNGPTPSSMLPPPPADLPRC